MLGTESRIEIVGIDELDSTDGEWEMQRELYRSKNYLFVSDLSIYFGFGYQSLNKFFQERQQFNQWSENAMLHGKTTEPECVSQLRDFYEQTNIDPIKLVHNTITSVVKITTTFTEDIYLAGTPDAFLKTDYEKAIIEIKCPFNHGHKFASTKHWARAFITKHKRGYANAFIQALAYAIIFNTKYIKTCFYFKKGDTEERTGLLFDFEVPDWEHVKFLNFLNDFQKLVIAKPKKYRDVYKKEKQDYIKQLMKESLVSYNTFTYVPTEIEPIQIQHLETKPTKA